MWIALSCVLAILVVAGALLVRVASRLRRRVRAVLRAGSSIDRDSPRVFDEVRMRHRGSCFSDGISVPERIAPAGVVPVSATAEGVFIGAMAIPPAVVDDAALVSGRLRLRWRAGREAVETWLEADRADLERLRREIHLRQANIAQKLAAMIGPKP